MFPRINDLSMRLTCILLQILLQSRDVACHHSDSSIGQLSGNGTSGHHRNLTHRRGPENDPLLLNDTKCNGKERHASNDGSDTQTQIPFSTIDSSLNDPKSSNVPTDYDMVSKLRRRFKRSVVGIDTTVQPFVARSTDTKQVQSSMNQSHILVTVNFNLSTSSSSNFGKMQNPYNGIEYSRKDRDDTDSSSPDQDRLDALTGNQVTLPVQTDTPLIGLAEKYSTEQYSVGNTTEFENQLELASTAYGLDLKYEAGDLQRRNVSSLLDFLMSGYDKRLRPGFGGDPVVVLTDIVIRSMGPISEKDMIYSMDCYFRQKWIDNRLSFNASREQVDNVTLNVKMLDWIWKPDTIFINGGHSYIHTITSPNMFFRLSHDGSILYSQRLTIKANCPMHLEKFPMDTQQCPLHIGSFGYSEKDVHYEWRYGNHLAAITANDVRMSQFDLTGMPACNITRFHKGTKHSVLTVFFDFRRHTGYFLIQVYLPCSLLVVLSWVSFWINREATSERISLGAMTVLTLTLIVLDTRNDLPRVNYPTALDIYVAMCFGFIFASIVQFAAVHFYTKYGTADEDLMPFLDSDDEV